ncbi:MAG: 2-oxoglutarate dehydrogenase E1 component [Gemmatimonadota bacterium]|jgi:2-oxoglutarate dehydrogenase E1 component|nr:2-oxoglutarate dehydrogenase E1 component [Gemmatimonadota bacterium]
MSDLRSFHGPNAGYVLDQFERFQRDPQSVDAGWRSFFQEFNDTPDAVNPPVAAPASESAVPNEKAIAAHRLAQVIRSRGHTASRLDPLGSDPEADPSLSPEYFQLTEADLARLPSSVVRTTGHVAGRTRTALEAIQLLREIYSGTIGYEFGHVINQEERRWLRDHIESRESVQPMSPAEKKAALDRLSQVDGFEKYLHKTYFGQKRFSIEGTDALVPIIDEIIRSAAKEGTRTVFVGMAHRGRLNVLTHVLGKPYGLILGAFQGAAKKGSGSLAPDDFTGDVKYHMGWDGVHEGTVPEVRVLLAPNPSHLEFVNPVVMGMSRAVQDDTSVPGGQPPRNERLSLPILVHGDAAFPGQGVVAETLNFSGLEGYRVGGTIHIIANNQVGFTTNPSNSRSTRYASDLAKGFEIPIIHVNADDLEACYQAARIATAYREQFGKDFLIDLVGYRRWGHNEGDEPLFTQPLMYEVIRTHPTAREVWGQKLVAEGVVTEAEVEASLQRVFDHLDEVRAGLNSEEKASASPAEESSRDSGIAPVQTSVSAETLREYNDLLLRWPAEFVVNQRLGKQLERRAEALGPEGGIDWGHAETLAFASLLSEGVPVRLTGQDVERGTFSHRHQVLIDSRTGEKMSPLQLLPTSHASFEIHNSPLTEMGVVGFEYGYTVMDPSVLVLWEAQFGDFANGAQVIIDQFISAAEVKWHQTSGLVLLLPHGYEGQGPEHSSARLERYLQLAAQGNLRVANCTTSAQYYHLLRRQAMTLGRTARPLVVMSPKSLLRHPMAASKLEDLAEGRFQPVIGDRDVAGREGEITRLVLCTGKVYVDLMAGDARQLNVAVARVEELYPFPADELRAEIESYPALREIVWVQEEPKNMGAWTFMAPRLQELVDSRLTVRYEGRPFRASPAEGYSDKHTAEQGRIVRAAWEGAPQPVRQRQPRRA